jgi:hypothetical protein
MTGFEALNQVLLACQSPHYSVLIVVLFIWILVCSSEPWLALVEIWQRNLSSPRTDTGAAATHKIPVAAFDVFNIFVALVLLIFSVLLDRCQHESVEVAAFIILNFGSYTLGPLKMVRCSRNPVRPVANILGHFRSTGPPCWYEPASLPHLNFRDCIPCFLVEARLCTVSHYGGRTQ